MITSTFGKSRPFNYILITVLAVFSFVVFVFSRNSSGFELAVFVENTGSLLLVVFSLFIVNFITKKNGITRDNSYSFLFYLCFLLFFPKIFLRPELIISSFFVLLSVRRLMSLQSLVSVKEKIFDASLWIFLASLFHFWSILFLVPVFASVIFHVSSDYRNWILPFIAFFAVAVLFTFYSLVFDEQLLIGFPQKCLADFTFSFSATASEKISLLVFIAFVIYFFGLLLISFSKKPLILHVAFKKIIFFFLTGVFIYLVSPQKSNELLVFTFFPLSVMAASCVESAKDKWISEIVSGLLILLAVLFYLSQL